MSSPASALLLRRSPETDYAVVPTIGDVRVAETPHGGHWDIEIYDHCEYTWRGKWVPHRGSYESQCAAERALESFVSFGKTLSLTDLA
jgi:hypothetical protein